MEIDEITEIIIGSAYTVGNILGVGFLEKVYENALTHEIQKKGLIVEQQPGIEVFYDKVVVGQYAPDLLVEKQVLVELKVAKAFEPIHFAQCLNYLKATGYHVCLLVNFGRLKVDIKRFVQDYP